MVAFIRRRTILRASCWLVLASSVPEATATGQGLELGLKLNGPLAAESGGGVLEARISPDGAWVVYLATQDSPVPGLFSAPIDGSGPARRLASAEGGPISGWELSARNEVVYGDWRNLYVVPADGSRAAFPITPDGDEVGHIGAFQISASGAHVVYLTANESDAQAELFSVRTDGRSQPARLSGPATIVRFVLDPLGERVAFVHGSASVYVAPIDGSSERLRLNGPQGFIPHYRPLLFSPRGDRLLYCARPGAYGDALWSVPVDASAAPLKLSGSLQPTGDVFDYGISPDGERVLYRADQEVDSRLELYSVPIDGSQPALKLNEATRNVQAYRFASGAQRVVYLSDQKGAVREPEIYTAPSDASAPPRELLPLILNDEPLALALGDTRVVYRARQAGVIDLYSVPIGRGEPLRLTHTTDPDRGPQPGWKITPDGSSVVYLERVGPSSELWLELRVVPVDGSRAPTVLGDAFRTLATAPTFQLSPDGKHAVLHADLEVAGLRELYSVPLDGQRERTRVNAPLVTERVLDDLDSFQLSADGSQVVFGVSVLRGEPDWRFRYTQLWSLQLDPSAVPVVLYPTEFQNGEERIDPYALTSDGQNVVFTVELGDSEPDFQLRSVPTDGSRPALTLSGRSGSRIPFRLTPDGNWVVFTFYQYERTAGRLRAVPVAGGPVIELSGAPVADGNILTAEVSPDGARAVYVGDARVAGMAELFSVPIDGSSAPVRLNAPLVAAGDVVSAFDSTGFLISPDGSSVVYLADQERNERYELYRVPIDGSAAPVKLNGVLPAGGGVLPRFQLSRDGRTIVYLANQATPGKFELFAGPLDGSTPAVRVSAALGTGGNVQDDFQLDPLGTRVVYRADAFVNQVFELFSAPLDGSAPALRLNGPLGPEGDVSTGFVVGPDGARALFRADAEADERYELFSAALGAPESAVKLSGDLPAGRDVLPGTRFSLDGALALYAADLATDERFELWATPSAGGKPRRLNAPLVPGGDVVRPSFLPWETEPPAFELVPDGRGVLYLADQDTDEAVELYLSGLDQRPFLRLPRTPAPRRAR